MSKIKKETVFIGDVIKRIETKINGSLEIKLVGKKEAKAMIIENHYSHKWNESFGLYNFGIYRTGTDQVLGIAVYGYMKNPSAKIFKCESVPEGLMIELNRMWISDELGMNAETVLIGHSLQWLKKNALHIVAVQSFADGRLGCGTIYKASNFRFYGWHWTRFALDRRSGEVIHEQLFTATTSATGYLRTNIGYLIGEYSFFRVKTYRYIYPLRKDFVFTMAKECPYPPYEKGSEVIKWDRDRQLIKQRIIALLDKVA